MALVEDETDEVVCVEGRFFCRHLIFFRCEMQPKDGFLREKKCTFVCFFVVDLWKDKNGLEFFKRRVLKVKFIGRG